ncbi:MAG: Holliday junction branch migration protein RuvA [Propionibacteriaceae bacterium]
MIAHLAGTVAQVGPTTAVIDLAGFGVLAQITPNTSANLRLGQPTRLATALVVREDALTLYGFATDSERDCFTLLITATGVGPKLALSALSVLSPEELASAIAQNNILVLTGVPGIGRKGAERIVIELRDKINILAIASVPVPGQPAKPAVWRDQVADGLTGLGWSPRDAEAACDRVGYLVEEDPGVSVPILMRAALQSLAKK